MKRLFLRALGASLLALPALASSGAQSPPPAPPASQTGADGGAKIIFSRTIDEDGNVTTRTGPGLAQRPSPAVSGPAATDSERLAISFRDLELEVHLDPSEHHIAVRARMVVANDGASALARLPLEISSSLAWEGFRSEGGDLPFTVTTLSSDADHTGLLHEAVVPLSTPLAPGGTLRVEADYSGTIAQNTERLVSLGMPEDAARHTDWDEVSPAFTGLRGFGNVVWYPVASVPVTLGDGSRLFDDIGRHKLSLAHTRFALRLAVAFPHGQPPTVALVDGVPVALAVTDPPDPSPEGVATASFATPAIGFLAPSLFVAVRNRHPGPGLTAYTVADDDISIASWLDEAAAVTPFLAGWLGHQPRAELTFLDLPDPDDAPFETGAMLATSLRTGPQDRIDSALAHALTHAWVEAPENPPPAWFSEGLATFMESLWIEKRHGRERALEMLEADRSALALTEPGSPGAGPGSPLDAAISPAYYRTKAAYVFWMLRDLAGEEDLASALRAWVAEPHGAAPASLESLLRQAGLTRDLSWFFSDWVKADKGLPDLAIDSVFPNPAQAGTWLVAVNITNSGYAGADAPVTVRTAKNHVTERVFVPGRGRAVVRMVVLGPPTQVEVNDGSVPETTASVHVTDLDPPAGDQTAPGRTAPAGSSAAGNPAAPPEEQ
jgi:hypothetical protein